MQINTGYEFQVGMRYLFGRRKEKFISLVSLISIIGIATGVMTLIIVIGVMSGFDSELSDRIIGTSSHIIVDKIGGLDDTQTAMSEIEKVDGVVATAPFVNTQALLMDKDRMVSVLVRGIDPVREAQVTSIKKFIKQGALALDGPDDIIIGKILAERMFVGIGDEVGLVTAADITVNTFKVRGIFSSDMYDYDSGVVFVSLPKAQALTGDSAIVNGISVKVKDPYNAGQYKQKIQAQLGFPYYTRTWMDLNRNLFDALKLEKTAMFVILTLIVLVAALNIASTLIMMVMEKTKDIGILKAIGATSKSIMIIFTIVGMAIGIMGTVLGVCAGLFMGYLLKTYKFIKLPEDIYYINTLPVKIETTDVVWVVCAAFFICLGATFYPAFQASRLNPVEALRYE
ncbi:MAG: lipoprotein-releasing ABC transporter permease subunit [Candidatus Omnitrophica bacterium]|nr:lipoprotein-releasing ABC transporter permease subunit [Candidatus Omnitrophota bacterium]MBU4479137.1 lipoprotein-releasing ABC transporter permease subunit [Candidatus Omnitrophota bacterium]MCG2702776.1 lipoprotein-releasing ABC transporter permease subunit [Candidatus Omnitrophota bacterium]